MNYVETGHLNNDFRTCLFRLMESGVESHPRGTTTREHLNYNISLLDPRNRIINFPARKTSLKYLLGEFIWYISGSNDPAGILPYAKFWDGIRNSGVERDLYPAGTINSNYGYRLFGHAKNLPAFWEFDKGAGGAWPINQWKETVELFKRDRDSRQAIMNIHVPSDRHEGNKDVPCTLTMHWFIRENELHLIVNMRSNDVIFGFTNDVFQFTMLQEAMLLELQAVYPELKLGRYMHNAGSMHIYNRHFEMAKEIIADERALEMSMAPMDRFDADLIAGLVAVEAAWQQAGAPSEFDFSDPEAWKQFDPYIASLGYGGWMQLTPYWQNLVLMCFAEDEEAMHKVFCIEHNDTHD